jgi:NTE family protein
MTRLAGVLMAVLALAGCATRNWNAPVEMSGTHDNDPVRHCSPRGKADELFVILAFSGGGMRSAAMSYGLLETLRDTTISIGGTEHKLIDEIDVVTSVSGGSYTAAYYGLFGERIFEDYETRFLKRDVQAEMLARLANPISLGALTSENFNRSDLAADWLDSEVFEGKTFSSMRGLDLPCTIINASDLNTGLTFSFVQQQFDFLCSDLGRYPVANAVLASSAVPVFFAPIPLRNYARDCTGRHKPWVEEALKRRNRESGAYHVARQLERYLDPDRMPVVRLVDGGVTDNLGIRGSIMSPVLHGGDVPSMQGAFTKSSLDQVTQVLVIISNAQSYKPYEWSTEGREPGIVSTTIASFDAALNLLNTNTVAEARRSFQDWERMVNNRRAPREAKVRVHFVSLTLEDIEDAEEREWFNAIPTSLSLEEEEIDALKALPRQLLAKSSDFERFRLTLP